MIRVVFDTVIFVRALLDSHSLPGRLVFKHFRDYRLFLAPSLIEEIVEVLGRKEIVERFRLRQSNYPQAMARLLKSMNGAEIIRIGQFPPVSRDPKDDKFLAAVHEADCDYLVTEDKDLLILKEYRGTKVINAATFIKILSKD